MVSVKELALMPVRGTVYVFSLPFVLAGKLLSLLYMLFVSTPLSWAQRFVRRVQVTWEWTKSSAKSALPWNYYGSTGNSVFANPRSMHAIEAGDDSGDYLSSAQELLEQRRPSSRSARRQRRKAIIASLIRALLEPSSPADSDDEIERPSDEDRLYQLVRELIAISRPDTGLKRQSGGEILPVLDLESLKKNARDKEKLLAFITELDEYVAGLESANEVGSQRTESPASVGSSECGSAGEVSQELFALPGSEGERDDSDEEVDRYCDAQLDLPPFSQSVSSLGRGLSPVMEVSPELASAESIENCADLETELNEALSRLSDMTSELEEAVEAKTCLTSASETNTLPTGQGSSEAGHVRRLSSEKTDSSFEDAMDEFPCIPKTPPILGLEPGHTKRDLAAIRKPRPPTHLKNSISQQHKSRGKELDQDHSSECSSDEDTHTAKEGLPHSLSDQLSLLSPSSMQVHPRAEPEVLRVQETEEASPSPAELYSTVIKDNIQVDRANLEKHSAMESPSGAAHKVQSRTPDEAGSTVTPPEASLFIRDRVPPWKQMRSRSDSNSESVSSQPSTPTLATAPPLPLSASHTSAPLQEATPPPVPPRTPASHPTVGQPQSGMKQAQEPFKVVDDQKMIYDMLPRAQAMPPIPSHAGQEGMYDIIPYHQQQQQQLAQQRTPYLHEKIERQSERSEIQSRPPLSWTPDLPPRNVRMRRTASAEVMDEIDREQPRLQRSGSERRSLSVADEFRREHSHSSKRRRSLSIEGDRSSSSLEGQKLQRHHGEHSSISRQRSSSEKQRSSSSRQTPTPSVSSSKPVEIGMGSFLKILVSPSSSKSKSQSMAKKKDAEEMKESRKDGKKRRRSSLGSKSRDEAKEHTGIPRNESASSLRSGVSMQSTGSSGSSGQDYYD